MPFQLARTYDLRAQHWYQPEEVLSDVAQNLFYKSEPDNDTQQFLDESYKISSNYFWQTIRNIGVMILSSIYTKTDINGMTGFGNMFLFSNNQFAKFMSIDRSSWSANNKKVLDLGAGNGVITEQMRPFFDSVYATELSPKMRSRLSSKGFNVLDALEWQGTDIKFDLITAFNLLDRVFCDLNFNNNQCKFSFTKLQEKLENLKWSNVIVNHYSPEKMLNDVWKASIRSNCNVIVSLVLPVSHYVEFNPNGKSTRPDNYLNVAGRTYGEHVHHMIVNVFKPANFEVIRWTRLPYLCEGDMNSSAYYLPDAVFLLKPIQPQRTLEPATQDTTTPSSKPTAFHQTHADL